ncbi:UNVERIFIED_CONTAM: hypothetical protein Slati_2898400 [Sesamum latifolium]|uniref:Uncharacterized protein n=1 Tax=Sesamum latifolium TaxID=2727402 RepID=A0AAW2VD92_9LAMI
MTSLEASSQHNNHLGASRDGGIALPLKFALSLGAKQKTQVVEKDLFDDNMIHSSSTSSKAEIATVMMVQTTSLKEQVASLTAAVGVLLKHEHTMISLTNSTKSFKNTVNEAIAKTYETRVQVFKSYMKPYTKRIEQLRMPENYQPPKFQQFNGHGDHRQYIAHFIETCNNAGIDGDLLTKQFVLSLKDAAFDCRVMYSIHALGTMLHSSSNKLKIFGKLATRAHEIEMSFNCKEDEYLVDVSEDDGDDDDATP